MPQTYHDISAILGKTFRIGYGSVNATITVVEDPETKAVSIQIDRPISAGSNKMVTSYKALDDADVVNLATLVSHLDATEEAVYDYIDGKISEMTGGTTGGNVMLNPVSVNVDDIVEATYESLFGTLERNKFIDRVVFEVATPFSKADGKKLEFSVGVDADKDYLVPKFSIEKLQSTLVVDVCKTLEEKTAIKLFAYLQTDEGGDDPFDPEFTQRIDNTHDDVATSLSTDAMGNVVNITLTGNNLTGEVTDHETFGEVTGDYMDFTINIPLKAEGDSHYRLVQQNPALEYYNGRDEYISNKEGTWTKDKTYTITHGSGEFLYSFLMTKTTGDDDYVHIYLYDLDAEEPDKAIRTYHIQNKLTFSDQPVQVVAGVKLLSLEDGSIGGSNVKGLTYSYFSSYENAPGIEEVPMDDPNIFAYQVNLSGEIHDQASEIVRTGNFTMGPCTMISFWVNAPGAHLKVTTYNPMYKYVTPPDEQVITAEGIAYTQQELAVKDDADGFWMDIPITDHKDYPIVCIVEDMDTGEVMMVTIQNQLTFLAEEMEPYEVLLSAHNVGVDNTIMPMAAGDTGAMRVRILSF